MIICKDCGHENETDDQFCGSCGSFLEWVGAKPDEVVTTPTAYSEASTDPTLIQRVRKGLGVDDESIEDYRQTVREEIAVEVAADQSVADQVVAERQASLEAERASAANEEARRAVTKAELERTEAENAAARAEREVEAARLVAEETERERQVTEQAERARREQVAEEAAALEQARRLEEIESNRLQAEATAAATRSKAEEEARAAADAADAAKQREAEAEAIRREAEERLSVAASAAAAAALRAAQEQDAIAAAIAAREAADADALKVRGEAEAATAIAQEEMAKARAEAAAARAESARLRSEAESRNAEQLISSARAQAEFASERAHAEAARRADVDAAAARRTADAEAEANAIRAKAEADAQAKTAEAEAMRLRAEAAAARARAEAEQTRQQAQADAAVRAREDALRRASALVAKPISATVASTAVGGTVPSAAKPKAKASEAPKVVATGDGDQLQPGAQLPGSEKTRPAPKRSAARDLNPGDLVCGQCGTGNPPSRKFCRRCGTTLAEAVVAKLGFFARLRRKFSRKPKTFEAGHRPKAGSAGAGAGLATKTRVAWFRLNAKLLRVGAMLGVVAMLGFGVEPIRQKLRLPNFRQTVMNKVREFANPVYDPVRASSASATSSSPDHAAGLLIDNGNNTFWSAAPSPNGAVGSKVTVKFNKPFDLGKMLMTSGVSGSTEPGTGFVSQPRPSEIRVTLNGDPENAKTVAVKDVDQPQTLDVKGKQVSTVEFVVTAVYPAAEGKGKGVAITEMEFFEKRKLGDDFETLPAPSLTTTSADERGRYIVDDNIETAWISAPTADGVDQGFTVTFAEPVDLERIRIAPGNGVVNFGASPRPREVQLVIACASRCEPTKQVRFDDKPGFKTVSLKARGVTSIQFQVRSVYGTGGGVAFAEVQFQRKRPKPL